ncbi:ABC transporter ATP-binding protein [Halalkalibacterium ligniniphilum]|uniref:ABC transporter ATP-binding protein n=1 Tax=Halalkalibacterium ligniniphilum TaxID=1134413 RepID=UPI000349C00D|nr:ABC transporter ATP-binding protein [Halalkalibacterium ligniniphilum]
MTQLVLKNLSHTYVTKQAATTAIENINVTLHEGEFLSILGPSGCGKTTLLSIISGLLTPTSGDVLLNGKNVKENNAHIGYMLQQDYLFPWLTIFENITVGLSIMGKLTPETKQLALNLLEQMGLGEKKLHYPSQLSGGMRQRVALVRMLVTQPSLMLLDEPFSALDYQTKLKLENLVFKTLKLEQKTALLVTHDIGEAIAMSDTVVLLSARPGRIHQIFPVPRELKALLPFEARQHPVYTELFQIIWKELEQIEALE